MHQHEVDVGGHVELAASELAHRDDDELRVGQRRGDAELGEVAHRAAHLLEAGEPAQVAGHDPQQHALAQAAQPAHQRGFAVLPLLRAGVLQSGGHFRTREGRRISEFGGELRTRRQKVRGVP